MCGNFVLQCAMILGWGIRSRAGISGCLLLVAAGFAAGCKSKAPPAPSGPAPKTVASSAVSSAQPRAPTVRESDAQAVLDKWLKAQNGGDFSAYGALYAERFQGVKRVGARAHRFDRKGWLKDRGAMFEKPMKVEISDVAIKTTCCMAAVRFVQKWSSATFQDQGTKELLMVPSAAGLQISGEEMLLSNVARAGKAADLDAKDIRLVVHAKHSYVVLGTADRATAGYGRIAMDDTRKSGVYTTRQLINSENLPLEVKNAKGLTVRLYGKAGAVCTAKLGETFLIHRVTPHFGTVQYWTGNIMDAPDHYLPAPPIEEVTQAAWTEGADGALYAAEILPTEGECSEALWAREADRPEPDVFRSELPAADLQAHLEVATRAHPLYVKMAGVYATVERKGERGPWEFDEGAKPEYLIWKSANRSLASVRLHVSGDCGGDFGGSLWLLFEIHGDQLKVLNDPDAKDEPSPFLLKGIVDANQDGMPELLGGDWQNTQGEANALLRSTSKGYEVVRSNYPPYHDCGC